MRGARERVNARVDMFTPRVPTRARVFHPRRAPFAESAESTNVRAAARPRARGRTSRRARGDAGETRDGGGDASSRGARRGRTRARRRDARRVESDGTRDDDGRVVGMEAMARAGVERRGDGGARERTREVGIKRAGVRVRRGGRRGGDGGGTVRDARGGGGGGGGAADVEQVDGAVANIHGYRTRIGARGKTR